MPEISVIVPVYNIENYLGECLESIAAQSFADFEALCVIDGSEDGSLDVARRMAERDGRFIVLEKENGGLSSARNFGIEHAAGDIVVFVDGDDSIEPNCLERVHAAMSGSDVDALVFGGLPVPESAANEWLKGVLSPTDMAPAPFSAKFMFSSFVTPYVWRNAVRRELLDAGLRFDEGLPFGEDVVFQFALYPRARKVACISDKLYRYRLERQGSLMDGHQDDYKRLRAHARIVEAVFREWKALGLLGRYPRELFTWSIDYLTHDVGLLPDEQRAECMRAANELWTRYFTEEGSCAARAVTACQCRGDGKLYVECAVDAAPFSVLEARAFSHGREVPVGAYPLSGDGGNQVWAFELPWLASPSVDIRVRPDGRACEQATVSVRFSMSKWISRIGYRLRADRCAAMRDVEQGFTRGRYQLSVDKRFPDGSDAIWRLCVRWVGPNELEPRISFADGFGAPLDLPCESLEFQRAADETAGENRLFISVRAVASCNHFIVVASDEACVVKSGFAVVDPTVDEAFTAGAVEFMKTAGDDEAYRAWLQGQGLEQGALDAQRGLSELAGQMDGSVSFSVVVDTLGTDEPACAKTLKSLAAQTYGNWNVLVMGRQACASLEVASAVPRVQWVPETGARRFDEAVERADGSYLLFLEAGDTLEPDALSCFANSACGGADVVFSDEDVAVAPGLFGQVNFKSCLNPDLLYSRNWMGSSFAMRRDLLLKMPSCCKEAQLAWGYDRILRAYELEARFQAIPRVLLHAARSYEGDNFVAARRAALKAHLSRRGIAAEVEQGPMRGSARVRYDVPEPLPLVSVVIPSKDQAGLLEACVRSLLERSSYAALEVLVVENNSELPETAARYAALENEFSQVKVVHWPGKFNFSAIVNFGVSHASGDVLLILNNDTELIEPDSITEMVGLLQRPEVGVVGAKLLFKDGLVQHAGIGVGMCGAVVHVNQNRSVDDGGYQGRACLTGDFTAVTGACQMVRRSVFQEVGGYDEAFAVGFNDIDFCMRLQEAGYLAAFTPYAQFYHYEFASRGRELADEGKLLRWKRELALFTQRWPDPFTEGDPFTSPNLSRDSVYYQLP